MGISTTPSFQQLQQRLRSKCCLPGSSAATAPTESCRRGAGVAGVALALPSLQGDNVMPPGLVAAATANQVWLIQHIWVTLSLNKSRKWEEVSNSDAQRLLNGSKLVLTYTK